MIEGGLVLLLTGAALMTMLPLERAARRWRESGQRDLTTGR